MKPSYWRVQSESGLNVYFTDDNPIPGNMEMGGTVTELFTAGDLKQAKREALLEAIDCARNAYESGDVLERLINMAKELE
jgi:Ran GTPase-activating protein (RanGAP) involved in mRNA processing and transport